LVSRARSEESGARTSGPHDGGQVTRLARLLSLLFVALTLLRSATAHAQSEPDISARASARQVEVGEPFTVELKALAEGGAPVNNPELSPPREFTVQGPQISTQTVANLGPRGASVKTGIG